MTKAGRSAHVSTVIIAVSLAVGCGRGNLDGLVRGQVLLDGQPLTGALVVFSPMSGEPPSFGTTDRNGWYELAFTSTKRGAFVGRHKVIVTTESSGTSAHPEEIPERVPIAFTKQETTPTEKTVVPGRQTINIDLVSP